MSPPKLTVALALALLPTAACKPPEPLTLPARADAPPNGKALMGGKPVEGTGGGGGMPDFTRAITVNVAVDAATRKVVANVALQPGFHAYGPGDATGRPLAFEVTTPGFALADVVVPAGVEKNLGDLGISKVVTGNVTASARVVPGEGANAAGTAEGKFHYQVCSDTACDRPRWVAFKTGG